MLVGSSLYMEMWMKKAYKHKPWIAGTIHTRGRSVSRNDPVALVGGDCEGDDTVGALAERTVCIS